MPARVPLSWRITCCACDVARRGAGFRESTCGLGLGVGFGEWSLKRGESDLVVSGSENCREESIGARGVQ